MSGSSSGDSDGRLHGPHSGREDRLDRAGGRRRAARSSSGSRSPAKRSGREEHRRRETRDKFGNRGAHRSHRSESPARDDRKRHREQCHEKEETSRTDSRRSKRQMKRSSSSSASSSAEIAKPSREEPSVTMRGEIGGQPKLSVRKLEEKRKLLLKDKFGYSEEQNPFGDASLAAPFIWSKKAHLQMASGLEATTTATQFLRKTYEKIAEIDSVKRRREERAKEEELMDEQRAQLAREREQENYSDWLQKEQTFVEAVVAARTDKRLAESREATVDQLAKTFRLAMGETMPTLDLAEPLAVMAGLDVSGLLELEEDARQHHQIAKREVRGEKTSVDVALVARLTAREQPDESAKEWKKSKENLGKQQQYWSCILSVIERQLIARGERSARQYQTKLPSHVAEDIVGCWKQLSEADLDRLELEIRTKLKQAKHDSSIDHSYWEALGDNLPTYRAERFILKTYQQAQENVKRLIKEKQQQAQAELVSRAVAAAQETTEESSDGGAEEVLHPLSPLGLSSALCNPRNYDGQLSPRLQAVDQLRTPNPAMVVDEDRVPWTCSLRKRNRAANIPFHLPPPELPAEGLSTSKDTAASEKKVTMKPQRPHRPEAVSPFALEEGSPPSPAAERTPGPHSPRLKSLRDIDMQMMHLILEESEALVRRRQQIQDAEDRAYVKLTQRREKERRERLVEQVKKSTVVGGSYTGVVWSVEVQEATSASDLAAFEKYVANEKKTMTQDEEIMAASESVTMINTRFAWEDRYKPRRPRFFNRVRTGYEWNKYNQTHYDKDNPPPKTIQGYKFVLFYPDLIDPSKTPTWQLESSPTPDTVIVRFMGGPPYQDVAFKIINREWDLNVRNGFRNVFEKGMLQLFFNLKRHRYRR